MGLLLIMAADSSAHHHCVWKLQSSNKLTLMDRVCSSYGSTETTPQHTAVAWQWETLLALCWGLGIPVPRRWVPQQRAAQNNTGMPSNRKDNKNYTHFLRNNRYLPVQGLKPKVRPKDDYLASNFVFTPHRTESHLWWKCRLQCGKCVKHHQASAGRTVLSGPHHHWGQWQGGTCLSHRLFLGPRFCVSLTPVSWGYGFQSCR